MSRYMSFKSHLKRKTESPVILKKFFPFLLTLDTTVIMGLPRLHVNIWEQSVTDAQDS